MTRYGNNLKNTADYIDELLSEYVKVPRTPFDNRNRIILDTTPYAIVPFDVWEMLPNSDAYLDYDLSIISKIPTVKRLLSGMTAEVRVYRVNYNDCWEGWNNFITKGRSGKIAKSIPYLDWSLNGTSICTCLPYNPYFYLGIAPSVFISKNTESAPARRFSFSWNSKIRVASGDSNEVDPTSLTGIDTLAKLKASTAMRVSALPAVAYNKIVKLFKNSNLLQDNPHWYPENENHDMILPYSASGAVSTSEYDNPTASGEENGTLFGTKYDSIFNPSVEKNDFDEYISRPWLNVLQYADRKSDYFTTGSPFPDLIRGDVPTLQVLNAHLASSVIDNLTPGYYTSVLTDPGNVASTGQDQNYLTIGKVTGPNPPYDLVPGIITSNVDDYLGYLNQLRFTTGSYTGSQTPPTYKLHDTTISGIQFSMNQWRYLATLSIMRERLALTDGSYNEMIKSMFGHNPKWHNHEPQYCGGFTQPLVFSEVVNTAESDSAPLGDTAGRAVSASQHPTIHVHSDDFGMFMSVLVIKPDEYYCQGVDKMWSRLENAEQYFPILNNLAPDATKNKELYVSGTNSDDEDVFNHQERFAYYKSRRNRIAGLLAMPSSLVSDVSAFVMKRLFGSTPNFNAEFTRGKLTSDEKSVFAGIDQAEFNVVIGSRFKYVGPIPRNTRPSDMGISY